jgi:hypothetical protein
LELKEKETTVLGDQASEIIRRGGGSLGIDPRLEVLKDPSFVLYTLMWDKPSDAEPSFLLYAVLPDGAVW